MEGGFKETLTKRLYERIFTEEITKLKSELGEEAYAAGRFAEAADVFTQTATADVLPEFLTIPAYSLLEA
jgi:malate synthase